MEATPFEHVVVALEATYEADIPTVSPLTGLLTVTVANAEEVKANKVRRE
jgi:hypothetical protein